MPQLTIYDNRGYLDYIYSHDTDDIPGELHKIEVSQVQAFEIEDCTKEELDRVLRNLISQ